MNFILFSGCDLQINLMFIAQQTKSSVFLQVFWSQCVQNQAHVTEEFGGPVVFLITKVVLFNFPDQKKDMTAKLFKDVSGREPFSILPKNMNPKFFDPLKQIRFRKVTFWVSQLPLYVFAVLSMMSFLLIISTQSSKFKEPSTTSTSKIWPILAPKFGSTTQLHSPASSGLLCIFGIHHL